jgi:hypothetical protein
MKRINLFFLFSFLLTTCSTAFGAKIDTVFTRSNAMNKSIKAVVIAPDTYSQTDHPYPVLYLLDELQWLLCGLGSFARSRADSRYSSDDSGVP